MSALLAQEWTSAGHQVEIMTQTAGSGEWGGLVVHRQPSASVVRALSKKADFYFQNNLSVRTLWPAFDQARKVLILHQTYLAPCGQSSTLTGLLKRWVTSLFCNAAVSEAVAQRLPRCRHVVGNPYDDAVFRAISGVERRKDLVFVGRLVSDKGVDVLLRAMGILRQQRATPELRLTVVGSGPEEDNLKSLAHELGLAGSIHFVGQVSGHDLALLLNQHRIMVVPSRWPEPFGVVALEGAACGCLVVGSDGGGLVDAIGPCGRIFESGNAISLARELTKALASFSSNESSECRTHLKKHSPKAIAAELLSFAIPNGRSK